MTAIDTPESAFADSPDDFRWLAEAASPSPSYRAATYLSQLGLASGRGRFDSGQLVVGGDSAGGAQDR
jgi:hypothetical protein